MVISLINWGYDIDFFLALLEIPDTKLHTLLLDHKEIKLTWVVDWNKKEVLFNVDEAFTSDSKWFAFGFSKRGELPSSDVCFFIKDENQEMGAIVGRKGYPFSI